MVELNNQSNNRWTQPLDQSFIEYLLELEVRKATRYLYYFSVLVIKLDKLDSSAWKVEEEAASQKLSEMLREEIRGTDLLGKKMDKTFFIILNYADMDIAGKVANRIRERVALYTFETATKKEQLTVSIGVSCFPTSANDVEGLVQKAGEQLIKAERRGGNVVSLPE
jgi:diguanylate cyclase (GGDEF)-like protein